VSISIPRFVLKALKIIRREANEIRKNNGDEVLEEIK
jgi:hypothetical protein